MARFASGAVAFCLVQSIDCQHARVDECSEVDNVAMLQSVTSMSADRANSEVDTDVLADFHQQHGLPGHYHHYQHLDLPAHDHGHYHHGKNPHHAAGSHELLSNKEGAASATGSSKTGVDSQIQKTGDPSHSDADLDGFRMRQETHAFYQPQGLSDYTIQTMMGVLPDKYNGFSSNHRAAAQVGPLHPTGHTMVSAYPGLSHSPSTEAQADAPSAHAVPSAEGTARSAAATLARLAADRRRRTLPARSRPPTDGVGSLEEVPHHATLPDYFQDRLPHSHDSLSAVSSAVIESKVKVGVEAEVGAAFSAGQSHHLSPGHTRHPYRVPGQQLSAYDMLSALKGNSHNAGTAGKIGQSEVGAAMSTPAALHHHSMPHHTHHGPPHFHNSLLAEGLTPDFQSVPVATQGDLVEIDVEGNAADLAATSATPDVEESSTKSIGEGGSVPYQDSTEVESGADAQGDVSVLVATSSDAVVIHQDAGVGVDASVQESSVEGDGEGSSAAHKNVAEFYSRVDVEADTLVLAMANSESDAVVIGDAVIGFDASAQDHSSDGSGDVTTIDGDSFATEDAAVSVEDSDVEAADVGTHGSAEEYTDSAKVDSGKGNESHFMTEVESDAVVDTIK